MGEMGEMLFCLAFVLSFPVLWLLGSDEGNPFDPADFEGP